MTLYDEFGRPVHPAATVESDPHGLTPQQVEQMRDRFEHFMPKLADSLGSVQTVMDGILPPEAALSPGAGANYQAARQATHAKALGRRTGNSLPTGGDGMGGGFGGNTFQTTQRPYQPEFGSPDRQQYPVHRILANRYWRLFYKLDPVIGNGIDLLSDLPFGEFELTGEGVDGEVKDIMEYAAGETRLRSNLPFMTREFLITGEAAPHLFWDDSKGCWTFMTIHNPDQLEVIDAPFIRMEPVVEFKPDPRLHKVLSSPNPQLRQVRETMPAELLHRLQSNQNIPLDSNNFTFLPRKLHPYDTRGTSIISRMWRILMYEDCFVYGTRVRLSDGTYRNIEDVQIGDEVIAQDGSTQCVTNAVVKPAEPVLQFSLRGKTVTSTFTHRWPVKRDETEAPFKLEAKDVRQGDYFLVPRRFEAQATYTPDLARLLGYYIADGCVTQLNHLVVSLSSEEWAGDVLRLLDDVGIEARVHPYVGRPGVCIRAHKMTPELLDLIEWFQEHAGRSRLDRRLSSEVMAWTLSHKLELMRGYFRAVGKTVASLTSEDLFDQLWEVFAHLGWVVSRASTQSSGRHPRFTYAFEAQTTDVIGALAFGQTVNAEQPYIEETVLQDSDFMYYPIESVKQLDAEPVAGITVTGDHSYVANGLATYNSIFDASIATARRHAGPIKVAKLGNPANGWIPGPDEERKLLELLAQAELDVNSWLVYHYGINFELVGTTERVMTIDKHYELIERVKLVALGISKAFLHGEVTYASAATGLTVFLRRLKAHRTYFEDSFLYPKFWKKMAMVNKWVKPTQAELDSRVRVRRSSSEIDEDQRWIIPTMQWAQSLDPTVDGELINAMQTLEGMGVRFSKTTKMALVGRDFEEESKQRISDAEKEEEIFKDHPELLQEDQGGVGGGLMPGLPGGAFGDDLGGDDLPPEPEGASLSADDGAEREPAGKPNPFGDRDRIGMWHKSDVEALIEMMDGTPPDTDPWADAWHNQRVRDAIRSGDNDEVMEAVEDFLIEEDYPAKGIEQLVDILKGMRVVRSAAKSEKRKLAQLAENITGFGKMDHYDGL